MAIQLSKAQEMLIECLQFLKISKDAIIGVMMMIPEDEQIAEMASYLLENRQATENDILEKAVEISEK